MRKQTRHRQAHPESNLSASRGLPARWPNRRCRAIRTPKSPYHHSPPQLAAYVLLTFYLRLSYRDMEEWLRASDQVRAVLELPRVPDHSTLARAYQPLLRMEVLAALQRALLEQVGVAEEVIAVDATSFVATQAGQYHQSRIGRRLRAYHKGAYAVGTQSQFILAWRQRKGPSNEAPFLDALRRVVRRYGCLQLERAVKVSVYKPASLTFPLYEPVLPVYLCDEVG